MTGPVMAHASGWPDNCTCDDNVALLRDGHRQDCPYPDGPTDVASPHPMPERHKMPGKM